MRAIDIAHREQANSSLALDLETLRSEAQQYNFVSRFAHHVDEVILRRRRRGCGVCFLPGGNPRWRNGGRQDCQERETPRECCASYCRSSIRRRARLPSAYREFLQEAGSYPLI